MSSANRHRARRRWAAPLAAAALLLAGCAGTPPHPPTPAQRRLALLDGAASRAAVAAALDDEDRVVRRTAARVLVVRALADPTDDAAAALRSALANDDVLVRRASLLGLCRLGGPAAWSAVETALGDSSALVRLIAVEHLAAMQPRSDAVLALLGTACDDGDAKVRELATRATWPFHRDAASLRDGGTDRDVAVADTVVLPATGWRFHLDPQRLGHRQGWYEPGHDDADWAAIAIEQVWQQAGYDYTGVAWYRRTVDLPPRPQHLAVDLSFGGVDESAWVWVNGRYAGDHDIGPAGWNDPFRLDVTELLEWGRPNQITVRAMNTAHGGGVWKPIVLEVLR